MSWPVDVGGFLGTSGATQEGVLGKEDKVMYKMHPHSKKTRSMIDTGYYKLKKKN